MERIPSPVFHDFEAVYWPDVTTLDTSVVTDIPKLADEVPQTEDAVRATLFLAG